MAIGSVVWLVALWAYHTVAILGWRQIRRSQYTGRINEGFGLVGIIAGFCGMNMAKDSMNRPGDLAVRQALEPARWISGSGPAMAGRTTQSSYLP